MDLRQLLSDESWTSIFYMTTHRVAAASGRAGWMMGPWLVFGALLNRCTMALFQGPPLGRPFGDFVSAAQVTMLGVVRSFASRLHTFPRLLASRTTQHGPIVK